MPASAKAFAFCVAIFVTYGAIHLGVGYRLEAAMRADRNLTSLEQIVVSSDRWISQWLPYALLPILLAPVAVTGLWAVRRSRADYAAPSGNLARADLRFWVIALGGAVLLGVTAQVWMMLAQSYAGVWFLAAALVAFEWASAGAVWAALWLQAARHKSGQSRLEASHLALSAFLVSACAPLHLIVAAIPLALFWASRKEGWV